MRHPPSSDRETQRLRALRSFELLDTLPEQPLDDLTALAANICGAPWATIALVDEERVWFKSKVGLPISESPRAESFSAHAILQPELMIVADVTKDPRFGTHPRVNCEKPIRFYAGAPLTTADGHVLGTLSVIDFRQRDLSADQRDALVLLSRQVMHHLEMRRQALQLATIQKHYHTLVEQIEVGVLLQSATTEIVLSNPRAAELLGLSEEQLRGRTSLDPSWNVTREDGTPFPGADHPVPRAIATRHAVHDVVMGVHRPGTQDRVWLLVNANPLLDDDGQVQSVTCTFHDITRRKQAEDALRLTELRFRQLFEANAMPVAFWTPAGKLVDCNAAWAQLTGMDPVRARAGQVSWIASTPPELLWRDLAAIAEIQARGVCEPYEKEFLRPDGSRVSVLVTGALLANSETEGLAFAVDLTERKQMESARQRLEVNLRETQKLESLGVLAGGIAHDFNNILTAIISNTSLAALDLPAESPVHTRIAAIMEASRRAADLCSQMLAYSGKGRFAVGPLSLNRLIEDTQHLLQVAISKKAALHYHLFPELPPITADTAQLRQVLLNLVTNASEAIGDQSGIISVNTGLARVDRAYLSGTVLAPDLPEGTYVYLEVSDSGCGMSLETQAKVFDPFFSTKFSGRGLGLSAVLGIVRGHKGALKLTSELGRGSTFKLLFPCAAGITDYTPTEVGGRPLWEGTGHVLVVDDEESIRTASAAILQMLGLTPVLAANGREALDIFQADPARFTLVLMDLTMPKMDGASAFVELRRIRPEIRVVLMSGFSEIEAWGRFQANDLAGFLQKPFDVDGFCAVVGRVLASPGGQV